MIQWIKDLFKSKEEILNDKVKRFCFILFRRDILEEIKKGNTTFNLWDMCLKSNKYSVIITQPEEVSYDDLDKYIIRCRYDFPDGVSVIKEYCYGDIKQQMLVSEFFG